MKKTLFIIFLLSLFIVFCYIRIDPIISVKIDNEKYQVRKLNNYNDAGLLLHKLKGTMTTLINDIVTQIENVHEGKYYGYCKIIQKRLPKCEFRESSLRTFYATFTHNKGTHITICLRDENDKFYDWNTLLYVMIHEIAHIGCPEKDHTDLFYEINTFILSEARKMNIYQYVDYAKHPVKYRNLIINNTILEK